MKFIIIMSLMTSLYCEIITTQDDKYIYTFDGTIPTSRVLKDTGKVEFYSKIEDTQLYKIHKSYYSNMSYNKFLDSFKSKYPSIKPNQYSWVDVNLYNKINRLARDQ